MEPKHFYFISDRFFEDYPDPALMQNKEDGHGRPCFLAILDENGLFWMIPISSKVDKFKKIYEKKTRNGQKCDTLYFANILGKERAFLIQNMFPIVERYVVDEYKQKSTGRPVMINEIDSKALVGKSKRVLAMVRHGKSSLIFPNVLEIASSLKTK